MPGEAFRSVLLFPSIPCFSLWLLQLTPNPPQDHPKATPSRGLENKKAGHFGAASRGCCIPPCRHSRRLAKARHSLNAALWQRVWRVLVASVQLSGWRRFALRRSVRRLSCRVWLATSPSRAGMCWHRSPTSVPSTSSVVSAGETIRRQILSKRTVCRNQGISPPSRTGRCPSMRAAPGKLARSPRSARQGARNGLACALVESGPTARLALPTPMTGPEQPRSGVQAFVRRPCDGTP
jgi:hypothetical protein